MIITQVGSNFFGVYAGGEEYSIKGTISGTTAKGRFNEGNSKGDFTFNLSKSKKSFKGKWRYNEDDEWSDWNGMKKK